MVPPRVPTLHVDDEEQEKANMTHMREALERRIAAGDPNRGDR
jgi:hypothetical protein